MRRLTKADVSEIVEHTMERIVELRAAKSVEYAEEDDGLSTVRSVAKRTGQRMSMVILTFMSKHLDAVEVHVRKNDKARQLTEPIEGRIEDAILYLCLLKATLIEERDDE